MSLNLSSITKFWPVALVAGALALVSAHRGGSLHNVPLPHVSFNEPSKPVDAPVVVQVPPKSVVAAPAPVTVPEPPMEHMAKGIPPRPHKRKPTPAPAVVVPAPVVKPWECNVFFGFGKCGPRAD